MGDAVSKLVGYMPDASGHHLTTADIRELQLAALNERLQERIDQIKLVKMRADDAGVTEIRTLQDVVPLLLPHTAYKSYPESFLTEKRWDRLTKWLGTVSTRPTDNVDLEGVTEIDDWLQRLVQAGHFVSCSSGTTGKSAMLTATQADLDFAGQDIVAQVQWGSDIRVGDQRTQVGFGATAYTPRNMATGRALMEAFVDTSKPRPDFGVPPITIGSITKMIELRKAIADGTAKPGEIVRFEEDSAARQKALEQASVIAADEMIAKRHERFYITSMWAALHQIAVEVRNRGYSAKDFHPENAVFLGGGLKRAQLPADYKEFIYETFNLQPRFIYQMYGMQELNSAASRCQEGQRYHVAPWVVCLPLNKEGDALAPGVGDGEVEGRAAFFDLSLDGRWGGVISGDHVHVDFGPCKCGAKSPSIRDDIVRYADLEGDDKIGCAGTVDAYVRGMS
ncbi:hypothetical protein LJR225_002156 [Phenylobacterium sp. LjRoot225]|uniref:hypothetical protein n=1 Tax=Phenylobacterium sp. LjRoot225 TaxID=3342285 RepID=UPI003ED1704A